MAGETVRVVHPLPTAEAVRLFAARAAAASPGFALDAANSAAVEVICRRLDGLPLALELAATRVRALGVHELAERLGDRFRVLTGGHHGAPARQQTLRAVIDWSWELLTEPERIVLRRLAAHVDGCTLQAAEAVCAGDGVAREDVLGLLARLVDRSLVVMAETPTGVRYRLLESVAAYATERLHDTKDHEAVQGRHLTYYTELAEQAQPLLHGPGQHRWLRRLDAESANLRAALESAVRRGAARAALRLVRALPWYWLLRGRMGEARRALETALTAEGPAPVSLRAEVRGLRDGFALLAGGPEPLTARAERAYAEAGRTPASHIPPPAPSRHATAPYKFTAYEEISDPVSRARLRWFHAYALAYIGEVATSEELTDQALAAFREHGDDWGVAAAFGQRALHDLFRGDMPALARDSEYSVRLFRELGDGWGELQTSIPRAVLAEINGEYAEVAEILRDGLRIAEELGLSSEVSFRLSGLGRLALLTKDWDRARELHEKARRLAVEQGFAFGEIYAEIGLAMGARRAGDLDAAESYLHRVREWYLRSSSDPANPLILAELGFVAELRGDQAAARDLHLQGLAIARFSSDPRALALALEGLAGAFVLANRPATAARLLGAAAAARETAGAPLPHAERGDVDRITTAATTALGEAAFRAAFTEGTEEPVDELVTCLTTT
ncbi:hypothetical protein [Streptomyces sp. MST-110588]|uniref:ATP-binding protein n=1 Tax=Streptomyces sp. MST-110588 TaxID=2833628 RepID=UPI0020565577|nr:hypothetical protein KGS77_00990 [Streptomyces sp. MST-110588]